MRKKNKTNANKNIIFIVGGIVLIVLLYFIASPYKQCVRGYMNLNYDKLLPFISFLKLLRIPTNSRTDSIRNLMYNVVRRYLPVACWSIEKLKQWAINK